MSSDKLYDEVMNSEETGIGEVLFESANIRKKLRRKHNCLYEVNIPYESKDGTHTSNQTTKYTLKSAIKLALKMGVGYTRITFKNGRRIGLDFISK